MPRTLQLQGVWNKSPEAAVLIAEERRLLVQIVGGYFQQFTTIKKGTFVASSRMSRSHKGYRCLARLARMASFSRQGVLVYVAAIKGTLSRRLGIHKECRWTRLQPRQWSEIGPLRPWGSG